jgi:hypothetical protein
MRCRAFIITLFISAAAWLVAAHAQQAATPVVGYLNSTSPSSAAAFVTAFHAGLNEAGYYEGQNVRIEYRWAEGQYDRLPALVSDLVGRKVDVIVASGGDRSATRSEGRHPDDTDCFRDRWRPGCCGPGLQSGAPRWQSYRGELPNSRIDAKAFGYFGRTCTRPA